MPISLKVLVSEQETVQSKTKRPKWQQFLNY